MEGGFASQYVDAHAEGVGDRRVVRFISRQAIVGAVIAVIALVFHVTGATGRGAIADKSVLVLATLVAQINMARRSGRASAAESPLLRRLAGIRGFPSAVALGARELSLTGRVHPAFGPEPADGSHVARLSNTARPAGRASLALAGSVTLRGPAVDPAGAERLVECLGVSEAARRTLRWPRPCSGGDSDPWPATGCSSTGPALSSARSTAFPGASSRLTAGWSTPHEDSSRP